MPSNPAQRKIAAAVAAWLALAVVAVADVRVDRHATYYHADAYVFAFKSIDEDGQPLVDEGVQEIHFQCRLGPVAIRAKFEPAKMVAHDGPDY